MHVCVCTYMWENAYMCTHVYTMCILWYEYRGQQMPCWVVSLLPPCGSWWSNPGHQAWQQVWAILTAHNCISYIHIFIVFLYSIFIHWNDNNLKYLIQWLQEYNKALFRRKEECGFSKHTVSPSLDNWKSNWEKAAWGTQECRWLTRPSPS